MPGHYVFVRFFPGYSRSFPYHRFLILPDDEIPGAVQAVCGDWNQDPANRERLEAARAEWHRAAVKGRKEWAKNVQRWQEGTLARPGVNWQLPPPPCSIREILADRPVPLLRTGPADFEEIAAVENWRQPHGFSVNWAHNISDRYAVRWFDRSETADAAAKALRTRAAELATAAWNKHHWSDDDDLVALINPRFVAEYDPPLGELITANEQVTRFSRPAADNQTLAEACVRLYLAKLRDVLEQVRAMDSPAADPSRPPQPQVMRGAASKTRADPGPPNRMPPPKPYPVTVANHEQIAASLASVLASQGSSGGGDDGHADSPLLKSDHLKILEAMHKSPHQTLVQVDLAAAATLSDRTVGLRLRELRESGLVFRPHGPRGGDALTPKGRSFMDGLAKSDGVA